MTPTTTCKLLIEISYVRERERERESVCVYVIILFLSISLAGVRIAGIAFKGRRSE